MVPQRRNQSYAGIADDLAAVAQTEISRFNTPLPTITSEIIPPDMLKTAANTEGAYLKSAFWLARAARLARTKGLGTADDLMKQAAGFLSRGQPSIFSTLNPFRIFAAYTGTGDTTNPAAIADIFYGAAQLCNQAGVPNITGVLQNLSKIGTIQQRQEVTQGTSITDYSPVNLAKRYKNYILGAGALYLVILGVGGYLAWRNREKLGKAAKGIAEAGALIFV